LASSAATKPSTRRPPATAGPAWRAANCVLNALTTLAAGICFWISSAPLLEVTALARTAAFLRGCLAYRLEETVGHLPDEAGLLVELDAAPEQRLRRADASRSLGVSKSGVTRLVDRMEERGLIERQRVPKTGVSPTSA